MIRDETAAKAISELMLEVGTSLDDSVRMIKERCSPEEFESYRRAVGKVMGSMLLDVMNPLYELHPELKPNGLR